MPPVLPIQENMTLNFGSWLGCMSSSISVTGVRVTIFINHIFSLLVQVGQVGVKAIIEVLDDVCCHQSRPRFDFF